MKKFIKILLLLFLVTFSINVYAEDSTIKYNDGSMRKDMENYGVNKKWNINEDNLDNVLRTPYVDSKEKIYDFAHILKDDEIKEMKELINQYIEHTGMDMVFVTVDMPYVRDDENEEYASDFYDYNDFGLNDDNYSGVILIRNAYSENRYFNIYTFGEAQLYFDYDRCENILDDIYYNFSNDMYLDGFKTFVSELTNYYDSGPALDDYYVDENGIIHKDKGKFKPPYFMASLIGGIVSLIIVNGMKSRNKMVMASSNARDYCNESKTNYKVRIDNLINTFTTRHFISSSSSGSSSSHHSSSIGSSGGGHGGGGGRHG